MKFLPLLSVVHALLISKRNQNPRCGTRDFVSEMDTKHEYNVAKQLQNTRSFEQDPQAPTEVQVNFHVVMAGNSTAEGNIPDSWIESQINVLNNDYKNFHFNLNFTSKTVNSSWFAVEYGSEEEQNMKESLRVGPNSALNVYTAKLDATFPSDLPHYPLMDGVVVHFNSLPNGALAPYNKGRTLTHEAGHWFGLYHTFQDGCSYPNDFVEDTIAEKQPAFGCPIARKSCTIHDFDLLDQSVFNTTDFSLNKTDAVTNFMDYTDDACMTEFSNGQRMRMHAIWPLRL